MSSNNLLACIALGMLAAVACNQVEDSLTGAPAGPRRATSTSPNEPRYNEGDSDDSSKDDVPDAAEPSNGDVTTKSTMTFFVSSTGSGAKGGDLGGLAGADAKCKELATAVGGADHTWRAYLSATVNGNPVHAKDRIGPGPWRNRNGVLLANTVAELHAANVVLKNADVLDEKGQTVPRANPNRHDILTGTNADGTLNASTCSDWTSSGLPDAGADAGVASVRVGHSDAELTGSATDRWNSADVTLGCSQAAFAAAGGEGRIYCFAID